MSRLAAMKEFAFMKALHENGFPVPEPIAQNRHTIVMSLIDAFPLRQIAKVAKPAKLYSELMDMILELARFGLIHGDFNEFNLLIKEEVIPDADGTVADIEDAHDDQIKLIPIVIDFPQMVSIDHANAEMYFDRDVNCIKRFFQRKYHFVSDAPGPFFKDARKNFMKNPGKRLDVEVEASGFSRKMARELEKYMEEVGANAGEGEGEGDEEEEDDSEEEDSEEEEVNEDEPEQSSAADESAQRLEALEISEPSEK